jgi:hypothetical protein
MEGYLVEAFFLPTVALSDMASWEAIDDTHAKATMDGSLECRVQ